MKIHTQQIKKRPDKNPRDGDINREVKDIVTNIRKGEYESKVTDPEDLKHFRYVKCVV